EPKSAGAHGELRLFSVARVRRDGARPRSARDVGDVEGRAADHTALLFTLDFVPDDDAPRLAELDGDRGRCVALFFELRSPRHRSSIAAALDRREPEPRAARVAIGTDHRDA